MPLVSCHWRRQRRADVLECRAGGGWMSVFGTPFLLLGVLFWSYFEPHARGGDFWTPMLVGTAFVLSGGWLVFWRAGMTLHRGRGTLTTWWGFPLRVRTSRYLLANVERVKLSRLRPLDAKRQFRYFVELEGASLPQPLELERTYDRQWAHACATGIARFIDKPLVQDWADTGTPTTTQQ